MVTNKMEGWWEVENMLARGWGVLSYPYWEKELELQKVWLGAGS